jgi:hypothetical protein
MGLSYRRDRACPCPSGQPQGLSLQKIFCVFRRGRSLDLPVS